MKPLMTRRESARFPGLFVKKYAKRVFFDNLWDQHPDLLEARGHVELADGTVVVRAFTKIFNRFENDTDINRDENCLWVEKINGFMACATYVPQVDDVIVSTTGSLDSDFVKLAERYITEQVKEFVRAYCCTLPYATFMFEIVAPEDPHIIEEREGAYLIGMRYVTDEQPYHSDEENEAWLDDVAAKMGVFRPAWSTARFSDIVEKARVSTGEGYVVYGQVSEIALKIKSPMYLALKAAARKKDIESLDKSRVDEEFYGLMNHIRADSVTFNGLDEQARLQYMRDYLAKQ